MKKLVALLLVACMLLGQAALAEEALVEQAFLNGAYELLSSIDLGRDMLDVTLDYLGNTVFSGTVKTQENLAEVCLNIQEQNIAIQLSDTDLTVAADGQAYNLQFADVQALLEKLMAAADGVSEEAEALNALIQLFYEKVIQPDLQIDNADGIHIVYSVTAEALLQHVGDFVDEVLDGGAYDGLLENALHFVSVLAGQQTPALAELKAQWAMVRPQFTRNVSDASISFDFQADADFSNAVLTGRFGEERDMFDLNMTFTRGENRFALEGELNEERQGAQKTYSYTTTLNAAFSGDEDGDTWNVDVQSSGAGLTLHMDGNRIGKMGTVSCTYRNMSSWRTAFSIQADYAFTDEGLVAMAYVSSGTGSPCLGTLLVGENQFKAQVRTYNGQNVFELRLLADEDRQLASAYLEILRMGAKNPITATYDREKLVIDTGTLLITCTGAFESDHAYVIALHAEGESVAPGEEDACIRLEYEGEPGNFAFTGRAIGPRQEEGILLQFRCKPSEGISSLLLDQENVFPLTLETLATLLPH